MAVRNLRGIRPVIWIPPSALAAFKVTIERSDGTIDDITNYLMECKIEDSATEGIGTFECKIPNIDSFTSLWAGMEVFRYYSDYLPTAATLRFRGRIEKVNYQDNYMIISGRSESLKVMDRTVTKTYVDTETSIILKDLFNHYGDMFTQSNITASSTTLTISWVQKPFWTCVEELCSAAGFDCHIDSNLDVHYFSENSVDNEEEGAVHTRNLIEIGDFADDIAQVRNKIIVYGAEKDGIQVLYTSEDIASQTAYGVREEIVEDGSITTTEQAQARGDWVLEQKKYPPKVGEMKCFLLASIQPGQRMWISAPSSNIPPAKYRIVKYKHELIKYYTTISVEKEPRKLSHLLKGMVENDNQAKDTVLNPEEMSFSYNHFFDSDSGTHSNTTIDSGVLRATSTPGIWISDQKSTTSNVTSVYVRAVGETLNGVTFEISADDELHWESIQLETKYNLVSSIGKKLKIRVTFSDTDTQIDSLSVLYK